MCSVNSYIHVVNCVFCTFLLRYSLEILRQYVLHYKSFTGKSNQVEDLTENKHIVNKYTISLFLKILIL